MAFAVRNLSVLAYANGFTLWHYKAGPDTVAAADNPSFFSDAMDLVAPGDMLMVSASDGARILVASKTGESVITAPLS